MWFALKEFLVAGCVALCLSTSILTLSTASPIQNENQGESKRGIADDPLPRLISNTSFQRGKPSDSNFETYEYGDYSSHGCTISWNETHQIFEGGKRVSSSTQQVEILLTTLELESVRSDKYETGYMVSFTTIDLRPLIQAKVKTIYSDLSEDKSSAFSSGYAFYFSRADAAQGVARELKVRIRRCKS